MAHKFTTCVVAMMITGAVGAVSFSSGNSSTASLKGQATAQEMSDWAVSFQDSPEVTQLVEDAQSLNIDSVDDLKDDPEACSVILEDARVVKEDAPTPPFAEKEWSSGINSAESALKLLCTGEFMLAYGKIISTSHHLSVFSDEVIEEFPELQDRQFQISSAVDAGHLVAGALAHADHVHRPRPAHSRP